MAEVMVDLMSSFVYFVLLSCVCAVINSEVAYLGYQYSESYGISYKVSCRTCIDVYREMLPKCAPDYLCVPAKPVSLPHVCALKIGHRSRGLWSPASVLCLVLRCRPMVWNFPTRVPSSA